MSPRCVCSSGLLPPLLASQEADLRHQGNKRAWWPWKKGESRNGHTLKLQVACPFPSPRLPPFPLPPVLPPALRSCTQSADPSASGRLLPAGPSAGSGAQSRSHQGTAALTAVASSSNRPKLLLEVASSTASAVVVALADTGASTTLITKVVADRITLSIRDTEIELTGLNGQASTLVVYLKAKKHYFHAAT